MKTTAPAAVFSGPGKDLQVRTYPVTKPGTGQVLLRLERSGICGTDIHIQHGRLPLPFDRLVLGHEFVGRITALGSTTMRDGLGRVLHKGDTCIACVAQPCGKCFLCKRGETASCLNFGVTYFKDPDTAPHFHGGHAEVLYMPAENLVKVPRGIDLDAIAAFPCAGPTSIRAFDFAGGLERGELVVVQGTGPVGLFAIAWAARAGCRVVAIGSTSNRKRTALARRLGAYSVLSYHGASDRRLRAITKLAAELERGNGADVVFDASGSPSALPEGLNLVRTRGRYIVPGQYSDSGTVDIPPHLITFKAIQVYGSGQYKLQDIATYLRFLKANPRLQKAFASCITHRYPVQDANKAYRDAAKGVSIKGVFV